MPAVYRYQDTVADAMTGRPVAGAVVTVTNYPDDAAVTLYDSGGVESTAPVTTDSDGLYGFWTVPGRYNLTYSHGGIEKKIFDVSVIGSLSGVMASIAELEADIAAIEVGEPTGALTNHSATLKLLDVVTKGPWADVRAFGAIGNGVADDTSAFQAALDWCFRVFVPRTADSYVIDGTVGLALRSGNILDSDGATLLLKPGTYASTAHIITTAPGQNGSYNAALPVTEQVGVRGININGNIANVTGSATGINLYKVKDAVVLDCHIKDLPGTTGSGYGIIANYSNRVWIERSTVDRTDRQNICIWETRGAHIVNCDLNFSYLRDCILVSSNTPASYQTSHAVIVGTKCVNESATGTHVIRFSGGGSGVVDNCEISSSGNLQGIYIVDTVAQEVYVRGKTSITNCSYGIEVASNAPRYVNISDCDINDCVNGIKYSGQGTVAITGNRIKGTVNQPMLVAYAENKQITGNLISGGDTIISIRAESGGSTVFSNNIVRDMTSPTRSVFFIGDSDGYPMVANNVLTGNTADVITGTAGGYFVNNAATVDAFSANVTVNSYRTVYNAAVPTSSTWLVNDRVIRAPAAVGQPRAWTCTVAGTAGTLNGGATTANTTAASADMVVSSATGLSVGNYITVAGIGGTTTKKITAIDGTTITVDSAATNTVAGGAVSYVAPTFVSEGNL